MSYKIVVISCDKNEDLWKPFNICMEKYWKDHPEIIYSTETKANPYYKTISTNLPISSWTQRVYNTIKDLPCKNVLLMVDDLFIRQPVDNSKIENLLNYFGDNVASINLEKTFDSGDTPFNEELLVRSKNGKYKVSVMCNLWNKKKLMTILSIIKTDPWTFEANNLHWGYTYLISRYGDYIDFGYGERKWFGIRKGKWCREIQPFFEKEKIDIDLSIRGFYQ